MPTLTPPPTVSIEDMQLLFQAMLGQTRQTGGAPASRQLEINKLYPLNGGHLDCKWVWIRRHVKELNHYDGVVYKDMPTIKGDDKGAELPDGGMTWFYWHADGRIVAGEAGAPKSGDALSVKWGDGVTTRPVGITTTDDTTLHAQIGKNLMKAVGAAAFVGLDAHIGKNLQEAAPAMLSALKAELVSEVPMLLIPTLHKWITGLFEEVTPTRVIEVRKNGEMQGRVESPHPSLKEALEISQVLNNLWFSGPAGSGKTTMAHQLATALGRQFAFISCTTGMSESKLLGRMNIQGAYLPAEFVRIYEEGGVFLWDEFDAADPNVVLCANAAMANGRLSVPDRVGKPIAERHPDTILVVATNTWGRGATTEYTARESLDAATRDRFVLSKIHVQYAHSIESQMLGSFTTTKAEDWKAPALKHSLPQTFQLIRDNIAKHHLRRIMSTRAFDQASKLRALGWDDQRILSRYFIDWSEAERTKAMEGVI